MIEFKRKVFEFKLDGQAHMVKAPTVKQVKEFEKKTKDQGDEGGIGSTIEFLAGLGLSPEITEGMEVEHLEAVINNITGKAK